MPMSDQYVKLEEERRHKQKLEKDKKKKKQKKEKRGKHHRHNSLHTESEEDIAPAHHVDIITEEMPEVSCFGWWFVWVVWFICVLFLRIFFFFPKNCQPVCIVAVQELWFLAKLFKKWLTEMVLGCSLQGEKWLSFCAQKDKNCHWSYQKKNKQNKPNNMCLCYKSNAVQIVTSFIMLCCFTLTLTCCLVSRFAADYN